MTEKELQAILDANPEVKAPGFERREPLTPAAKAWLEAERKKLEERFLAWWMAIGGPDLEREYKFAPDRRFRADFCHLGSKVIVEIDGGLATNGAHNSMRTYEYQQERDRLARSLGYEVRRLGTGFELWQVEAVLDCVVERSESNAED